ncbi:hypothetical protein DPMN_089310 [Dreissena polymorpha]|uniref:Uncharacterized protein n=1 Tax=Dreissena polymorpha TaxID=45954 RepID=A0A9D4KWJ0_DREPO|nr:hypothetical protein DPMN_089310 [Dreissena polymorpha]
MPRLIPGESRQRSGRAPVYRHYAGTQPGYTGIRHRQSFGNARFNRGQPGLHRESIKMFNTSGMNRESPVRTGNDRLGTGTTGTEPGTTGTAPSERRFTYLP